MSEIPSPAVPWIDKKASAFRITCSFYYINRKNRFYVNVENKKIIFLHFTEYWKKMQGNSNKEGARHTPINLPTPAPGAKETGFIGSRQTTENSVTRFPPGCGWRAQRAERGAAACGSCIREGSIVSKGTFIYH
mgnify:CR=1 FL=1